MAKLANIIIGIVLFSLITTLFFKAAGDLGETHNSNDYAKYQELSSNYNNVENYTTKSDSYMRKIKNYTDSGIFSSLAGVLGSGVDAGKTLGDSIVNIEQTTHKVANDINLMDDEDNSISKVLSNTIIGIFSIIFILSILYFGWRAKAET